MHLCQFQLVCKLGCQQTERRKKCWKKKSKLFSNIQISCELILVLLYVLQIASYTFGNILLHLSQSHFGDQHLFANQMFVIQFFAQFVASVKTVYPSIQLLESASLFVLPVPKKRASMLNDLMRTHTHLMCCKRVRCSLMRSSHQSMIYLSICIQLNISI